MEYKEIYNFCPKCKSDLKADSDHYFKCPNCDFFFYVNPIPGTGVIIENNSGEVLLVKRKYDPKKDYWDVPGGFINIKESVEECIQREMLEELGTPVENLRYFASYPDRYLNNNIHYFIIIMMYTARISIQTLQAKDDVKEIKFFKKEEIPFGQIAFTTVEDALRRYID